MKAIIDVTDSKAAFIMELLSGFPYVTVQFVNEEKPAVKNPPKDGQVRQLTEEITVSPFVMSMTVKNPLPADYDYKTDYNN